MPMPPIAETDLQEILQATAPLWEEMRDQRLFLTGGTGFFGSWLVESFLYINSALKLNAHATVLTRDPEAFHNKSPHLRQQPALTLLEGDVRSFTFPAEQHAFVIHAATEASARQLATHPHQMLSTILAGTERTLTFAANAGTRKMLLTSSGAVYGPQPAHITHMPEEFTGAPNPLLPASVYGEGKRASELMCSLAAQSALEIKIARCYAFVGPHLPLDTHFAAGNFLADALKSNTIAIASDGTTVRSYLYASDLAIWLWTMLFRAPSLRAYNVGSEASVSIRSLADTVARTVNPRIEVRVAQTPAANAEPNRYVPSTARARAELGLVQSVSLEEALQRTAAWHRL
jgi:nucleoside-diphosphate-sugar epimerase